MASQNELKKNVSIPPVVQQQTIEDTYKKATTSLIVGIVGLFIFGLILGIVALVLGFSAKKEMEESGNSKGTDMATAGIVLGIIDIVGWGLFVLTFF